MKAEFSIKKQKKGGFELTVKGDLTVQHCLGFKDSITTLLSHDGELSISMNAVQAIDISAIQLLLAFDKMCKEKSKPRSINWPESQAVNDLLDKTGVKLIFG